MNLATNRERPAKVSVAISDSMTGPGIFANTAQDHGYMVSYHYHPRGIPIMISSSDYRDGSRFSLFFASRKVEHYGVAAQLDAGIAVQFVLSKLSCGASASTSWYNRQRLLISSQFYGRTRNRRKLLMVGECKIGGALAADPPLKTEVKAFPASVKIGKISPSYYGDLLLSKH